MNTNTSPVRSTLNTLLLVEAEQLLRVELLPTAATDVRLREEAMKVFFEVALMLVQCIPKTLWVRACRARPSSFSQF